MKKLLLLCLLLCGELFAQNSRQDGIVFSRNGFPAPSASIAVCSLTAITAASEAGSTVTITAPLNPAQGSTVLIAGVTPAGYNGSYTVLTTSGTNFTYTNPVQGLGAGSAFGEVVATSAFGGVLPCAPLASLCSSNSDTVCTSPNPVTGDGLGNYSFYVTPGRYLVQSYGSGLTARNNIDQVLPCDPAKCSISGTINNVTITKPATGSTLTIADGKTLTANNSVTLAGVDGKTLTTNNSLTLAGVDGKTLTTNNNLTLAGTDGTTQTFPTTSATIARTDAGQTFTGVQVFASPTINGTPTGTGIPTATLNKGNGAGNYTSASTTYVVIDSTNLCQTVTIPNGWKLVVNVSANIGTLTAAVGASLALTDNSSCATANAGILQENNVIAPAGGQTESISLSWVINGDGASHKVALQFKTQNGADSVTVSNNSSTFIPTMTSILIPSN